MKDSVESGIQIESRETTRKSHRHCRDMLSNAKVPLSLPFPNVLTQFTLPTKLKSSILFK